jgi:hypothetical protein
MDHIDFGKRLRADLTGQPEDDSVPKERGKPVEHLRQIFEYHKHSDWLFLQRATLMVSLNAGLLALYGAFREKLPEVALAIVLLGILSTLFLHAWITRLHTRMSALRKFMEEEPVWKAYVDCVKTPEWRKKRLHQTPAYVLGVAWFIALVVVVPAVIARVPLWWKPNVAAYLPGPD